MTTNAAAKLPKVLTRPTSHALLEFLREAAAGRSRGSLTNFIFRIRDFGVYRFVNGQERESAQVFDFAASQATRRSGQLAGHWITIYRMQPDGRWLLARDAHTLRTVER